MSEDPTFRADEQEADESTTRAAPHLGGEPFFDESKRGALSRALREKFDMNHEDADEIASVIAEQFGDNAEVNDETLEPTVRSIFYTLEAKKILSFRREEYTWENGERRRGFWWRLREDALAEVTTLVPDAAEEDVYAMLPKSVWSARQNA